MSAATKTQPIKVTPMAEEGGYVVARTDDVDAARAAAKAHEAAEHDGRWDADELPEVLERIGTLKPRVGWYRWTPCHESSCFDGGGHRGHLGYADGPARGVFRGVYLQGPW